MAEYNCPAVCKYVTFPHRMDTDVANKIMQQKHNHSIKTKTKNIISTW